MKIIELTQTKPYGYKEFFHQGLREDQGSFRISLVDDAELTFPTMGKHDSFTLGALTDTSELMGVVSFAREGSDREKLRHKGLLFRMYVSRKHSGQGIGGKLVKEVITRATALSNIEQINLTVIASNAAARHLYSKFGFESFSLEKNAIKFQGKYFDEETMALFL